MVKTAGARIAGQFSTPAARILVAPALAAAAFPAAAQA
jgi:hypothetical protein